MSERILAKVVVGSRLHGLHNEKSDTDYRGIHIHTLKDVLSPFKTLKNTSWIEGDEDNTSYELADFCKQAVHGNATILEVFFSDQIIESSIAHLEMKENWSRFMDTDKFVMASRGYAQNQYNKMNLFEPDARTPKFAVAYLRVLWQCARFLETDRFECQITEPFWKDRMLEVKHNWSNDLIPGLTEDFMGLQARITSGWATANKLKPDIEWIEDFIHRTYTDERVD